TKQHRFYVRIHLHARTLQSCWLQPCGGTPNVPVVTTRRSEKIFYGQTSSIDFRGHKAVWPGLPHAVVDQNTATYADSNIATAPMSSGAERTVMAAANLSPGTRLNRHHPPDQQQLTSCPNPSSVNGSQTVTPHPHRLPRRSATRTALIQKCR